MDNTLDLTQGKIQSQILKFTLPIVATSFINMAYSFIDMICIGALGAGAVASVGTASFFLWFANASASMAKIGAQITISQEFGKKDYKMLKTYAQSAFLINLFFGIIVALIFIFFRDYLISFFNLGNEKIINDAKNYIFIIAFSMPFIYLNHVITSILNAIGNSKIPFYINSLGLIFNIVFDIILIFGFSFIPRLEVIGAAIATALAHVFAFSLLMLYNKTLDENIRINLFQKINKEAIIKIIKIGFPPALQSTLYCIYSIIIARFVSVFGSTSIAVQKVGANIESISWMTAEGLAVAGTAFVGQNYGVKNFERIKSGVRNISVISICFGFIATILLIFFGEHIFKIFLRDPESVAGGISYLKILGYSQIFMCVEIISIGFFNGYGETRFPSLVSIILTGSRIPIALFLSKTSLGVDGIWWTISATSIAKGIILFISFNIFRNKRQIENSLN